MVTVILVSTKLCSCNISHSSSVIIRKTWHFSRAHLTWNSFGLCKHFNTIQGVCINLFVILWRFIHLLSTSLRSFLHFTEFSSSLFRKLIKFMEFFSTIFFKIMYPRLSGYG